MINGRNVWVLKQLKLSNLALFQRFLSLHLPRTWRLDESLKTTQVYFHLQTQMYIFNCQQMWKIYYISGSSSHKKIPGY